MDSVLSWLLEGEPWVRYLTRTRLMEVPEGEPGVASDWHEMVSHPKVRALLQECLTWPGQVVNSHKNASLVYHKLAFLADLGLDRRIPEIEAVCVKIMDHASPAGPFQVLMNIPTHFGGTGKDQWIWALCDAPVLLEILCRFGYSDHPQVLNAIQYLDHLNRPNGWPCACDDQLGKFRGPGKKEDPCPYATLLMVKLLSSCRKQYDSPNLTAGAENLLHLWQTSKDRHPYLFNMGTDFRKLKLPFIWYDILHISSVLGQIPEIRRHPLFQEMAGIIRSKAGPGGRYTPESVYQAWKEWDFGQKKEPSRLLTFFTLQTVKESMR